MERRGWTLDHAARRPWFSQVLTLDEVLRTWIPLPVYVTGCAGLGARARPVVFLLLVVMEHFHNLVVGRVVLLGNMPGRHGTAAATAWGRGCNGHVTAPCVSSGWVRAHLFGVRPPGERARAHPRIRAGCGGQGRSTPELDLGMGLGSGIISPEW